VQIRDVISELLYFPVVALNRLLYSVALAEKSLIINESRQKAKLYRYLSLKKFDYTCNHTIHLDVITAVRKVQ
jgi:hypothetical protein